MAAINIPSEKIEIFPCVSRKPDYDLSSRLMTEENITNLIKNILDKDSYVIKIDGGYIYFVIEGYMIKLKVDLLPKNDTISGYFVSLVPASTENSFDIIKGDNPTNPYFEGISITTDSGALKILEKDGLTIPVESQAKFNLSSFGLSNKLDFGELK